MSRKTMVLLMLGLAAIGVFYFKMMLPAQADLVDAQTGVNVRNQSVIELQAKLHELQQGNEIDVTKLFETGRQIDGAMLHHMDPALVANLMPTLVERAGFDSGASNLQGVPAPTVEGNTERITFTYTINGTLDDVMGFVEYVRSFPVLMTIDDFSVNQVEKDQVTSWTGTFSVTLWAMTEDVIDPAVAAEIDSKIAEFQRPLPAPVQLPTTNPDGTPVGAGDSTTSTTMPDSGSTTTTAPPA